MKSTFFLAVLGLSLISPNAFAADWPVFHGPAGDNKSTETGLLQDWPDEGPQMLWKAEGLGKTDKPSSFAGVVVQAGRVYTMGNVDKEGDAKTATVTLYCLDESTGKELWAVPVGEGWKRHFEGDRSTPTLDGERVYAFASLGQLGCFSTQDGKEIWTRNLANDYEAALPTWGYAQSVVVAGDLLIVGPGGKKASVVALDKTSGKTVWETPPMTFETVKEGEEPVQETEIAGYATPYLFEHGGRRIVALMDQKALLLVDLKDGALLARYVHETKHDINATMPYYEDGTLLITSGYGTTGMELLTIKAAGDGIELERIWQQKRFDNQHGGIIVLDGYVYGSAHQYKGGAWLCLKREDGELVWDDKTIPQGSCFYADGRMYCMDEKEGNVVLLNPSPEKFDMTGRFQLPQEGQGAYWAHPVVCNKKLYLRHDTFLYCYDVAK
ncbi:MAG TPA: hypothetical protein DEB39_07930 [Planctomycetaceae bacterium]|nr:hypothetical protein [Planctomycetaceae bacterium]